MNRRSFLRGIGAGALATGAALATGCTAPPDHKDSEETQQNQDVLPAVEWRMATSWTEALDVLFGTAQLIAERVANLTNGQFKITVAPAGEIVAALEVFDAVQNGTIQAAHTVSFYFIDKEASLSFATGLPFGLTAQQQNAWLYHGGGMEAVQEVFSNLGLVRFPAGNTGTQMGGWFKQEVMTLDDLQGLRFRIPGLGGQIMRQLGVEPVVLPGGEIYAALKADQLDAAEWVGPHDDENLKLHEVATYYYYPGWWEPGTTNDLLINQQAWDALPKIYQEIIRTVSHEVNNSMLSRYEVLNQAALARLVAGGTQLRAYSEDILHAAKNVAFEIYEERASENPLFHKIFTEWKEFRRNIYQWNRFNELSYAAFVTENIF
jgi:TRAP-type mannitol/chloroaromatic compound transport system substrate-binding protein